MVLLAQPGLDVVLPSARANLGRIDEEEMATSSRRSRSVRCSRCMLSSPDSEQFSTSAGTEKLDIQHYSAANAVVLFV